MVELAALVLASALFGAALTNLWWMRRMRRTRRRGLPPASRGAIDRDRRDNRPTLQLVDLETWDREDTHGD